MNDQPNTQLAITRWWWVRHAPAFRHGGAIYGNSEVPCDTSDRRAFGWLARRLPAGAVWLTSHLSRTQKTAAAIVAGGAAAPEPGVEPLIEPGLGEQDFGHWQGMTHAEIEVANPDIHHKFWLAPARHAPPGGESFIAMIGRVGEVIARLTEAHPGRDIVAVAHGGTIRAALAIALDITPDSALAFQTGNLSLTRLDHVAGPGEGGDWQIVTVNTLPR